MFEEGQIELAAHAALHQVFGLIGLNLESYHWMPVLEARQPCREIASKEIERHTETNKTGQHLIGHRGIGLVIELQNLSRELHELAALRGQFQHTALSARPQRLANLGFEFRDLLADRRLGAADRLPRP